MASGTQDLILGPTGNPYRTSGYLWRQRDPWFYLRRCSPNTVCDICPVRVPNGTFCVTPQLIEVFIGRATYQKVLILSN